MENKTISRIHSIDAWRFIAMFFVVAIHLPFLETKGQIVITFGKTAVPFFIMASGYFCFRKDDNDFTKRLFRQINKFIWISIISTLFYFIVNSVIIYKCNFTKFIAETFTRSSVKSWILVNESPLAGHLWFLGSMIYAMTIVVIFVKLKIFKYVSLASPLFSLVYILMAYSGKFSFIYCRNSIFCTMPYFMVGCVFRKYENRIKKVPSFILFVFLLILSSTAIAEFFHYKSTGVVFISTEFLVYVIFALLIKYPDFAKNTPVEFLGRRDTLFTYIVHFSICYYFWFRYDSLSNTERNLAPVIVFVLSYCLSEVFLVGGLGVCPRVFKNCPCDSLGKKKKGPNN